MHHYDDEYFARRGRPYRDHFRHIDGRYYPREQYADEIDREFDKEYDNLKWNSFKSEHHYENDFRDEF